MRLIGVLLTALLLMLPTPDRCALRAEFGWMLAHSRTPVLRGMRDFALAELVNAKGDMKGSHWRPETQPWQELFLRELDSDRWNHVALTACVQGGKSYIGYGLPALYHTCEEKLDTIVAAPTMKVNRNKWNTEIRPLFLCSRYADLLPTDGSGSRGGFSDEIILNNGARIKFMTGGGGDEERSSYTASRVVITEVDKMDAAGGGSRETDPITQLEARMGSFPESKRRFYCECTVSIPAGRIWQMILRGSNSRIACPCPHCHQYVTPEREHLRGWEEAESRRQAHRLAYYCCPSCGARITEDERRQMNLNAILLHAGQTIQVQNRESRVQSPAPDSGLSTLDIHGDPPDTDTLGFRANCFNNLFISAGEVGAKEWSARHTPNEAAAEKELCQFFWAVPYTSPEFGVTPLDPDEVRRRFAPRRYTKGLLPEDLTHLSMGVDLGKRVGHWLLIAWRPGCRGIIADYSTFEVPSQGMPVEKAIVAALEDLRDGQILEGWHTVDGEIVIPKPVFIDAGYQYESVCEFCRQKETGRRFLPALGRGLSQYDRRLRSYHHPSKVGAEVKLIGQDYYVSWVPDQRLFRVDVHADFWKSWLFERLRGPWSVDREPGSVQPSPHAPRPTDPAPRPTPRELDGTIRLYHSSDRNEHVTLAKHFTAERPEERFIEGRGDVTVWAKLRKGNHFLDAAYNACAAGHLAGVRLVKPAVEAAGEPQSDGPEPEPVLMPDGRPFLITER